MPTQQKDVQQKEGQDVVEEESHHHGEPSELEQQEQAAVATYDGYQGAKARQPRDPEPVSYPPRSMGTVYSSNFDSAPIDDADDFARGISE